MKQKRNIRLCALCLIFFLSGCANVLLTGASGGIAYTFTNVAYKTVAFPVDLVEASNSIALMNMEIRHIRRERRGDSVIILAETPRMKINIELEEITPKTTKISVDAVKSFVIKDKATAAAVIEQTEAILAKQQQGSPPAEKHENVLE